jgi:protein gp37
MSANSKIEWTDHTFNPWIGCTKIDPGCAHCYADAQDKFRHWTPEGWGKGKPRRRTSAANWNEPLKWNREAEKQAASVKRWNEYYTDHPPLPIARPRVFCASLADWLDDDGVPTEWRVNLLETIHATPNLDWQLLTKRPENWKQLLTDAFQFACDHGDPKNKRQMEFCDWIGGWVHAHVAPANVWVGASVCDPDGRDRIRELQDIPAKVRFLSCEPLLGKLHIAEELDEELQCHPRPTIDWVISGGESGPKARLMHPNWARYLRDQCTTAGVPFFFKQWGDWLPGEEHYQGPEWKFQDGGTIDSHWFPDFNDNPRGWCVDHESATVWKRVGKKVAGRLLDGRTWDEFPMPA